MFSGGFDGTSNVLAGKLYGIPVKGTHADAYITSFTGFTDLRMVMLSPKSGGGGEPRNLLELASGWRSKLESLFQVVRTEASDGELAALISFAIAFPDGFVALIDTYDAKRYSCRMTHASHHSSMTCHSAQHTIT